MTKDSITNKLQELVDLKNSGVITNEEFDKLKKQLMEENEPEIQKTNLVDDSIKRGKKTNPWFLVIGGIILILIIFFVLKSLVFTSNSEDVANDTDSTLNSPTETELNSIDNTPKYSLKSGSIADIPIGSNISVFKQKFPNNKSITKQGEEGIEYPAYEFYIDKITAFDVSFKYDDQGNATDFVNEANIYSNLFKTETGIGVGSTLAELSKAYPDIVISSHYQFGTHVASGKLTGISFEIDIKDYIGNENTDDNQLKFKDFKPNAKIYSITLYNTQ